LQALDNFVLYIREEASKYSNPYAENIQNTRQNQFTDEAKNQVRWKGTTIDFVQLIYALQEAGYLDNEERQITSLVEQVSKIFNHHLSDHWQSNFSDNANNRNNDYQPKIFSNLMQAFESRRARLIESKRKNRLK
jgi:hypothetical protein